MLVYILVLVGTLIALCLPTQPQEDELNNPGILLQAKPLGIIDHHQRLGTAAVAGIPHRGTHGNPTAEQARPGSGQRHNVVGQVDNLIIGNQVDAGY